MQLVATLPEHEGGIEFIKFDFDSLPNDGKSIGNYNFQFFESKLDTNMIVILGSLNN